ncbi:IS3 family transposase, partial [Lactobacillus helveticus]|uniref:IS3 family transposase n=3 Tax=Lactobacillus helveticus TaxID=1587 RepID=UPI002446648A
FYNRRKDIFENTFKTMNELDQTIKERIHYHNHKTVLKKHTPIEYRNMLIKTIYPQFLVHIIISKM